MLMANNKKIAAVILGKMNGPKVEESPLPVNENGDNINNDVAYEAAAQSFINAVKKEDAKGVVQAFKDMCDLMELEEEGSFLKN